ncbi:MAG: hypothetical protein MI922_14480, partial [Bacteroidales bacterium]|nr:hypothetical protein [Bacteroidales bacterium]
MLRGIAVILNLFLLVILEVFQGGGISVDISAPTEVTAGVEFQVNVSINKGDLKKFSRLQQILPAGLTATSVESANSDFSFEEKRVRHLWLKMPEEENINLIYTIKPDIRLKGEFAIDGKFSYIEENERRSVTVKSLPIVINPSPAIDPSKVVDLADYEKLISPYTPVDINEPQIACIRQTPSYDRAKDEYVVELLVSKERKERFAKIEEAVPRGYRAEVIDDHDAIFTFKDNKAKFLWMNLPASSIFTVKYKLV